jgi:hypothetical protein
VRVALLVEVDDALLTEYVQNAYLSYEGSVPWSDPADWLRDRLQDVAQDELPGLLHGWVDKLGMRVTVGEVEPSLPW